MKRARIYDFCVTHMLRFTSELQKLFVRIALKHRLPNALFEVPVDLRGHNLRPPKLYQCSFRVEIVSHYKAWSNDRDERFFPEWALDNKLDAYQFMSSIDVMTPKILFRNKSFAEIDMVADCAIKPEDGFNSNGVFVVDGHGAAREVLTGVAFTSADQIRKRMETLVANGSVERDRWYCEERIGASARSTAADVKFYCFYGEVLLALKVDREGGVNLYQTIDRSGQHKPSGKYVEQSLPHIAVSEENFSEAERISSLLPCPFIRLDFLVGKQLIFGEIGNLVGGNALWSNQWDRELGDAFARARGRLYQDLRRGKQFAEYERFLQHRTTM